MLLKLVKMTMFIVVLVLCYFANVDGQGRARPGWAQAGYEEAPELRGWLALRRGPRDWSAAAADCLTEDAALASPWSPEFTAALGALAAREGLPMLYSGARATLPFIAGGAGSSPGELVRCSAFLADSSSTDVPCTARLPYVCYAADPGPASRLWPGYEYSAVLRGWLKLHNTPRDWPQARIACHLEGAFLTAPWSPEFTSAMRALAARAPPRTVHAGVRVRQNFVDAAYSYIDGAPVLSVEPAALLRREACITLHANGTECELSCKERLPFVCYAPLPTTPGSASPSPSPLPLRPTTETVTIRTLRTVPTSSNPITNPTTTTTTPVPKTTTDAPTSAVPTTSTTTLALTTKPTSVPTTSTAIPTTSTTPVPTTTSSTTPSDVVSQATAAPFNVCEEIGLAEYRWEEETEQCYRFHPYGATWPVANKTCASEGAALAVANSREEAILFTRLLLQHLKSGIRDAKFMGAVALGFYWDQDWKTVDGTPLEETGYAKWWPGWPRDQELARWGFMEHTGRLENYVETVTTPFICEAQ